MFKYRANNNQELDVPKKMANTGVNVKAFEELSEKFDQINSFIAAGKEIPKELTKNFVTFPLSDNPFKGDW
jgi:hypothetical protein